MAFIVRRMTVKEFREWQERLRMKSYDRLSEATGFDAEQIGRWNRGEDPIPFYVFLAFAALFHKLDEAYG